MSEPSAHSRPYSLPLLGLLLSLLLYVGGGMLAVGHFHGDDADVVDHDCATCLLAATTVAAVGAMLPVLPRIVACTLFFATHRRPAFSAAYHARARAPPALLI